MCIRDRVDGGLGKINAGRELPKRGEPCNCGDFAGTHIHQISLVDEFVKTVAFGGCLELLPRYSKNAKIQQKVASKNRSLRQPEVGKVEQTLVQRYGRLLPQGLGGAMDRLGPYRGPRRPIAPPR